MTRARRLRIGPALPYHRLAAISLILAATMPAALLGILVYDRVEQSLSDDAIARTDRAVSAAATEVEQSWRELDDLVRSYAEWNAFAAQVEKGDLESVRLNVLEFLVEQGSVDGGLVVAPNGAVRAGSDALATALQTEDGRFGPSPRFLSVDGQVYLVDDDAIRGAGATELGRLVLARKLDARFVTDIAGYTGFSVAVLADDGTTAVTTDAVVTDGVIAGSDGSTGIVRSGDLAGRRVPLGDGSTGEQLVVATRVSALQATAGTLPILIPVLVALTGVVATMLAMLLSAILRRRLGVVHDGLIAVADGRVPPAAIAAGGDDIARLAAGLDRLVRTLDRRENTLRACLAAATAVPIHVTPAEAARRLAAASVEIFGVAWCEVVTADGTVIGRAGDPSGDQPGSGSATAEGSVVEAILGLGTDQRRLEAGTVPGAAWTDGDQAGLEVMALLVGSVLTEVEAFGRAMGRADRLDRLNRLQREFLRSISHNLRAPLATIELAASDLVDLGNDPYVTARAEAIRIEEQRLARLVNQVLLLSRMETGTLSLEGEPVALPPLVRRVVTELALTDRVEVIDRAMGTIAFTDPAATEQIAWILLDNAARYAGDGPIRVEILAAGDRADPAIILAVEDEGPGVPQEDRRRIFGRFVRGGAGQAGDGTGLGLSVARGLARSLGGDVTYRSGAAGARFEVRLPAGGGLDDLEEAERTDGAVSPHRRAVEPGAVSPGRGAPRERASA